MYISKLRAPKDSRVKTVIEVILFIVMVCVTIWGAMHFVHSLGMFALFAFGPGLLFVFLYKLINGSSKKQPIAPMTSGTFAYRHKCRNISQGTQPELVQSMSQARMTAMNNSLQQLPYADIITNVWVGRITDVRRVAKEGTLVSANVVQYECDYIVCSSTETEKGTLLVYEGEPKVSDQLVCLEFKALPVPEGTYVAHGLPYYNISKRYYDLGALAYGGYDSVQMEEEFRRYYVS